MWVYLSSVYTSARLAAAGNRPCWKDTSQLIMTGHHKSPAAFAAWRGQCDLAGSPWQMADLAGDWHLYHPSAPSASPLLCKGCQSQPLLLWFPAPSLPCAAATIGSICQPHGEVSLSTSSAHSSQAPRLLSFSSLALFSLCHSLFIFSFVLFLSSFPCLFSSIGIISFMAIKGTCWCWRPE